MKNTANLNMDLGGVAHGYSYDQLLNNPPPSQKGDLNHDNQITDAAIALTIAANGGWDYAAGATWIADDCDSADRMRMQTMDVVT